MGDQQRYGPGMVGWFVIPRLVAKTSDGTARAWNR